MNKNGYPAVLPEPDDARPFESNLDLVDSACAVWHTRFLALSVRDAKRRDDLYDVIHNNATRDNCTSDEVWTKHLATHQIDVTDMDASTLSSHLYFGWRERHRDFWRRLEARPPTRMRHGLEAIAAEFSLDRLECDVLLILASFFIWEIYDPKLLDAFSLTGRYSAVPTIADLLRALDGLAVDVLGGGCFAPTRRLCSRRLIELGAPDHTTSMCAAITRTVRISSSALATILGTPRDALEF